MILRDRLEKLPNNSILIISANKKIYRDEIINHYNKNINKLAGARVLICHSDESVVLPIITALDGIVEVFALISPTIPSELISSLAIKGNFEVITGDVRDGELMRKSLKKSDIVFNLAALINAGITAA